MKLDIKKILSNVSADKKRTFIVVLGIAGIVLIFFSNFIHTESGSTEESVPQESEPLAVESYR